MNKTEMITNIISLCELMGPLAVECGFSKVRLKRLTRDLEVANHSYIQKLNQVLTSIREQEYADLVDALRELPPGLQDNYKLLKISGTPEQMNLLESKANLVRAFRSFHIE